MPIDGFFGNPIQVHVPYLDLSGNLLVKFARNPKSIRARLNAYTKQIVCGNVFGNYLYFDPAYLGRRATGNDPTWAYNSNRPQQINDGQTFETKRFETVRYSFEDSIDMETVKSANWEIQKTVTEAIALRAMVNRTYLTQSVIHTTSNYPSANVVTATVASGSGFLDGGSTADPRILNTFNYARNLIQLATASSFDGGEFGVMMNPNTARKLMATRELREYLMQQSGSGGLITGKDEPYWAGEGLPAYLYNAKVIVENCTVNVNNPGAASDVQSYVFPDNVLVFFLREGDLDAQEGTSGFSSFTQFVHEDMTVEAYTDQRHRRLWFSVTDNFVAKVTSPISVVYITNVFS